MNFLLDHFAPCVLLAAGLRLGLRATRTILFSLMVSFYAGGLVAFVGNVSTSRRPLLFLLLLLSPIAIVFIESAAFNLKRHLTLCSFLLYLGFDSLSGGLENHGFHGTNLATFLPKWTSRCRMDLVGSVGMVALIQLLGMTKVGTLLARLSDNTAGQLLFGMKLPSLYTKAAVGLSHLMAYLGGIMVALRFRPSYEDSLSYFFFALAGALLSESITRIFDVRLSDFCHESPYFFFSPTRSVTHFVLLVLSVGLVLLVIMGSGGQLCIEGWPIPLVTTTAAILLVLTLSMGARDYD